MRAASGTVYEGCNIENASYGLAICAERVAVFCAVAAGEREIEAIAICTEAEEPAMPCGACRQVLVEFGRAARIVVGNPSGTKSAVHTIGRLLPDPFVLEE